MDRNKKRIEKTHKSAVALRKESVDRNNSKLDTIIESIQVALRKESVDRNKNFKPEVRDWFSRSPQGERG